MRCAVLSIARGRSLRMTRRQFTRQRRRSPPLQKVHVLHPSLPSHTRPAERQSAVAALIGLTFDRSQYLDTSRKRRIASEQDDTHHPSHQTRTSLRVSSVMMTVKQRDASAFPNKRTDAFLLEVASGVRLSGGLTSKRGSEKGKGKGRRKRERDATTTTNRFLGTTARVGLSHVAFKIPRTARPTHVLMSSLDKR